MKHSRMRCVGAGLVGWVMMVNGADLRGQVVTPELVKQADELEKRWGDFYLKYNDPKEVERLNKVVEEAGRTLGEDGRFSDLKYEAIITGRDGGKEGWGPHLIRVADLFTAWRLPGTKGTGDRVLARKAAKALEVYCAQPYDTNDPWGFGHPYADLLENNRIGRCLLFARTDPATFSQEEIERWGKRIILSIFKPSENPEEQFKQHLPGWEGGANVMWASRGELARFLTQSDQALRVRACNGYFGFIWDSMTVVSGKGERGECHRLTVDGMLGEHDTPAMGSYGEWYVNAVVEYRDLIEGIPAWQMPEGLNKLWIDVILDSAAHCYQGAVDPHLGNPLIWLNARRGGNAKLKEWVRAFQGKGYREAELAAVLAWEPGVTDWPFPGKTVKAYHTIDYVTKHFPRYMVSLRAVSERTYGMETFGQRDTARPGVESVLLPLGVSFVRRDTGAFQSLEKGAVWGAMDYARLPGLTTRWVSGKELAAAWNRDKDGFAVRGVSGNTPFVAIAATDQTAVYGWWQSKDVYIDRTRTEPERKKVDLMVDGRRATFFLEDAVVHLGAGFDVRHGSQVTLTNLEQRLSAGTEAEYGVGGEVRKLAVGGKVEEAGIGWVVYDGVGYLPPAATSARVTIQDVEQAGNPAKPVFSVFVDHGREASDLAFEWAVVPGTTAERMAEIAGKRPWRVVANTSAVQAIEVEGKNWVGAVFHQAGSVETSLGRVSVDRPAAVVVEKVGDAVRVYAADPFEKDGGIVVSVGEKKVRMELPGGKMRGATVRGVGE